MAIVRYLTIRRNRRKSAPFCAKVCNARPSAVARDASGNDSSATAVAIQSDGGIVVAGSMGMYLAVVRYLPDGTEDPNFQQWDASGAIGSASSVVIQPNNMILVGGTFVGASGTITASARGAGPIRWTGPTTPVTAWAWRGSTSTARWTRASTAAPASAVARATSRTARGTALVAAWRCSPTAVLSWREASVIPPTRSSRRTCRWWSG